MNVAEQATDAGATSVAPNSLKQVQTFRSFNPDQVQDALDNIRHSLTLNLPQFRPRMEKRRGVMCLVGGGPSLEASLPALRRLARLPNTRIIAYNDAVNFLIGHGVRPWGTVYMEVAPWRPDFMANPPNINYLMASQCHPTTYERMAGQRITQWHAREDIGENELLTDHFGSVQPTIAGGVTAITRTFALGLGMGYRRFELFGADSSHTDTNSHVYYDRKGQKLHDIFVAGKWFKAPGYLVRQAEDLIEIVKLYHPQHFTVRVHGEGMFPHAARAMGVHVDNLKELV